MAAIPKPKPRQESSGGWIVTFADLMSLLLTFFILLLSFSSDDHNDKMLACVCVVPGVAIQHE